VSEGYQTRKKALIAALAATYYCTMILQSHRDFKHSEASIWFSLMHQRWALRGFLALLKTLSHSVDISSIERVLRAVR
jgi:hypothetical protein